VGGQCVRNVGFEALIELLQGKTWVLAGGGGAVREFLSGPHKVAVKLLSVGTGHTSRALYQAAYATENKRSADAMVTALAKSRSLPSRSTVASMSMG
jgi:hypothetical protein